MVNQVENLLPKGLFEVLQKERFLTISTVDYETGGPNITSVSWVFAPDPKHVLFAIDSRSRTVKNIENNPLVVLNLLAIESAYAISGNASIKIEKLNEVPLKLTLVEVNINEVRDVMFYGSKISVDPKFEKTYDKEAAAKLDRQVMEAIRKA
ncbi:pyridoxamine 5'-phosphate oxidase family protein [Bacillus salitolerans]|uniref:Pyridoxamine 5'-phosphate oxidase family protein n=1 Tax=Bacillus salitolerans TaxID=1437434 RepID=A0ABW4LL74_9BACI